VNVASAANPRPEAKSTEPEATPQKQKPSGHAEPPPHPSAVESVASAKPPTSPIVPGMPNEVRPSAAAATPPGNKPAQKSAVDLGF